MSEKKEKTEEDTLATDLRLLVSAMIESLGVGAAADNTAEVERRKEEEVKR